MAPDANRPPFRVGLRLVRAWDTPVQEAALRVDLAAQLARRERALGIGDPVPDPRALEFEEHAIVVVAPGGE
jgi:hypothetical protein